MPFIRRRSGSGSGDGSGPGPGPGSRSGSGDAAPPPPGEQRLADLEFLALVRASLEAFAPGVTRDAELRGSSLISPRGWAVAVAPPHHGGAQHYDLVALPDVSVQPDVPCFMDCVVAMGDPRHAADSWVHTAGACLLALLDQRSRFADRVGPDGRRGVPGWHLIASDATGYGLDAAENWRLQAALVQANVLHRIADTFVADLESPYFNGIKVFYGGRPGSMATEVRVNGERHEAASAAMAALELSEPKVFTAVRYYALLLPVPADGGAPGYPSADLGLEAVEEHDREGDGGHESEHGHGHGHGALCGCGEELDPERPGFALALPQLVLELSAEERKRRTVVDTGVVMVVDGVGNFLKARLPIRLEDGRTVVYLVWIYLEAAVIQEFSDSVQDRTLDGRRFNGLLCNTVGPWGLNVLRAPVVLANQRFGDDGSISLSEIVESSHPLLAQVVAERWPAEFVLGDRGLRLRA